VKGSVIQMRTPRLLAAGVSGLLGAAALVGATTGSANAASYNVTSSEYTYNCQTLLGNGDLKVTFMLNSPEAIGVQNAVGAHLVVDPSLADALQGIIGSGLDVELRTWDGSASFDNLGGFGFGSNAVSGDWKWTMKSTDPVTVDGLLASMPAAAAGDNTVTPPAALDFRVAAYNVDSGCTLADAATAPAVGNVTVGNAAEGTPLSGKATVKGNVITYTATAADGNGGTEPGTGTVKATGKVKVAKGKKTVSKPVTVTSQLKNGKATLKVKFPKGTKAGKYKFTVTWSGKKSTVTVKK